MINMLFRKLRTRLAIKKAVKFAQEAQLKSLTHTATPLFNIEITNKLRKKKFIQITFGKKVSFWFRDTDLDLDKKHKIMWIKTNTLLDKIRRHYNMCVEWKILGRYKA